MGGFGSGGHNAKPPDQHWVRGTWRRDRHAANGSLPPDMLEDARTMYRRLKRLGAQYMAKAEKGGRGAARALTSAIKCWHEALNIASRVGPVLKAPEKNKLDEYLERRSKVARLVSQKEETR